MNANSHAPEGETRRTPWVRPFADAEWEARFRGERWEQGLKRSRWALLLGLLLVGGTGAQEAALGVAPTPEHDRLAVRLRFWFVEPIWLALLGATWRPGFARVAEAALAGGTTLVCWALLANKWHFFLQFPGAPPAVHLILEVVLPLAISSAAFPLGGRALAAMALAATLAPALFVVAAAPPDWREAAWITALTLTAAGAVTLALGRWREAGERRRFAQRERERAREAELARLTEERNEFVAIAAHDLRAPLAAVRGLAENLVAGRLSEPAQNARAVAAIHELSGRMLGLVNAYLGAHAAENGALEVRPARVALREFAAATAARHAALAAAKGQTVFVEADVGAGAGATRGNGVAATTATATESWALADTELLAQIADNFVTNALKFSPHGAAVRIEIEFDADGGGRDAQIGAARRGRVRLAVADSGPGIAAAEQAGLFKKFGRASTKPTGGEASHGLGLAVAKRLAEAMGGRVGCESPARADGTGARFWVELPAAE
ncbi:MAG: hypothetical protein RLZZ15_2454 [Verrucomicrobiota bacterium]|jgi:signal transduction histidine kinase